MKLERESDAKKPVPGPHDTAKKSDTGPDPSVTAAKADTAAPT